MALQTRLPLTSDSIVKSPGDEEEQDEEKEIGNGLEDFSIVCSITVET